MAKQAMTRCGYSLTFVELHAVTYSSIESNRRNRDKTQFFSLSRSALQQTPFSTDLPHRHIASRFVSELEKKARERVQPYDRDWSITVISVGVSI